MDAGNVLPVSTRRAFPSPPASGRRSAFDLLRSIAKPPLQGVLAVWSGLCVWPGRRGSRACRGRPVSVSAVYDGTDSERLFLPLTFLFDCFSNSADASFANTKHQIAQRNVSIKCFWTWTHIRYQQGLVLCFRPSV